MENLPSAALPADPKKKMSPLAWILILSGSVFTLFLVFSGITSFYGGGGGKSTASKGSGAIFGGGSVGIVEISGAIMDSKRTLKRLEQFEEDDSVKAVVIRLNSPGGAVGPSQEIYEAVRAYKKPVVASMGSIAASGAFYIAMGAKRIFTNAGTLTGSIGVIMEFANLEKLYDWAKIKRYVIKTGEFKDTGSEAREMTPEDRQLLQTLVDDVLVQFKQAVADGRHLKMEEVSAIADGRVLSGSQAKKYKLVDEIGTLQDAVKEAGKLAGLKGKPTVVYPERMKSKILDFIMDDASEESSTRLRGQSPLDRILLALTGGDSAPLSRAVTGLDPGIYWIWQGAR